MTTILIAFLLAFVVSAIATRLIIPLARRLGVVDKPDGLRKTHARPTPLLGGVAIYVAFLAPFIALFYFSEHTTVSEPVLAQLRRLAGVLIGGTLALALGVLDDRYDLRPRWKFAGQLIVAWVAYGFGFRIGAISNPFGPPLSFGVFALPITLFWFVGCMNAVNLLDGIDGLAAGMSLFVSLILFLVGLQFNNIFAMFIMAALVGATLGFLLFNFPPARIFLGDSGTMLLGFLVAALAIVGGSRKAEAAVALFVPVVALGLPILDTTVAIVRRWYHHLPLSSPDRSHIHHLLMGMGVGPRRAVLSLYLACVVLGALALLITVARSEIVILVMGSLAIVAFVAVRVFSGVHFTDVLHKLSADDIHRRQAARARLIVERAAKQLAGAADLDAVWSACEGAFRELELHHVRLLLTPAVAGPGPHLREWRSDPGVHTPIPDSPLSSLAADEPGEAAGATPADSWCVTLALRQAGRLLGRLVLCRHAGDNLTVFESADLLDTLRAALAGALAGLAPSETTS